MAESSICTCMWLVIHVDQIAGEFGQGGEKVRIQPRIKLLESWVTRLISVSNEPCSQYLKGLLFFSKLSLVESFLFTVKHGFISGHLVKLLHQPCVLLP